MWKKADARSRVSCICFFPLIPRGLTVALWTPSGESLRMELNCYERIKNYSNIVQILACKATAEGVKGATAKPPAKPFMKSQLHPKGLRRGAGGDRKAPCKALI